MSKSNRRPPVGRVIYITLTCVLGSYFAFASIEGNYGLLRRAEVDTDVHRLQGELTELQTQVAVLENKTQRMSDDYLDLDLLDEQVRDVLGYVRADEIILQ